MTNPFDILLMDPRLVRSLNIDKLKKVISRQRATLLTIYHPDTEHGDLQRSKEINSAADEVLNSSNEKVEAYRQNYLKRTSSGINPQYLQDVLTRLQAEYQEKVEKLQATQKELHELRERIQTIETEKVPEEIYIGALEFIYPSLHIGEMMKEIKTEYVKRRRRI